MGVQCVGVLSPTARGVGSVGQMGGIVQWDCGECGRCGIGENAMVVESHGWGLCGAGGHGDRASNIRADGSVARARPDHRGAEARTDVRARGQRREAVLREQRVRIRARELGGGHRGDRGSAVGQAGPGGGEEGGAGVRAEGDECEGRLGEGRGADRAGSAQCVAGGVRRERVRFGIVNDDDGGTF